MSEQGQQPDNATRRRSRHKVSTARRRVIRLAVYERDGWKCQLCGIDVDRDPANPAAKNAPTLDHIVPFSAGGRFAMDNLRLACWKCNHKRGAVTKLTRDLLEAKEVVAVANKALKRKFAQGQKGPAVRRGNQAKPLPNSRRPERPRP